MFSTIISTFNHNDYLPNYVSKQKIGKNTKIKCIFLTQRLVAKCIAGPKTQVTTNKHLILWQAYTCPIQTLVIHENLPFDFVLCRGAKSLEPPLDALRRSALL